jgi:hypothetical protein
MLKKVSIVLGIVTVTILASAFAGLLAGYVNTFLKTSFPSKVSTDSRDEIIGNRKTHTLQSAVSSADFWEVWSDKTFCVVAINVLKDPSKGSPYGSTVTMQCFQK